MLSIKTLQKEEIFGHFIDCIGQHFLETQFLTKTDRGGAIPAPRLGEFGESPTTSFVTPQPKTRTKKITSQLCDSSTKT